MTYAHVPVIAYIPALNEAEDIRGACKNALEVLGETNDHLYVLYDPRTTDQTREIIETEFPEVAIWEQDTTLGNSTRTERGGDEITFIHNVNKFLHDVVPEGTWVGNWAADERYDPADREKIRFYVDQADALGFTGLCFDFVDLFPDEEHRMGYETVENLHVNHYRFFKYFHDFAFGTRAHDALGERGTIKRVRSGLPFYHFGNLKDVEVWWRGHDGVNLTKNYIPCSHPFKNWRDGTLKPLAAPAQPLPYKGKVPWHLNAQRALVKDLIQKYAGECNALPLQYSGQGFYYYNYYFQAGDAEVYYSLLRDLRPQRVVEVGGGYSTWLAAEALARNERGGVLVVDPTPRANLPRKEYVRHLPRKVQDVPLDVFTELEAGDVLFIDSSHVDWDARYLCKRVAPLLRQGVWVHWHDIWLPAEYPPKHKHFSEQPQVYRLLAKCPHRYSIRWSGWYFAYRYPRAMTAWRAWRYSPAPEATSLWVQIME